MRRRPRPILVESCPKALQPLADEAALVVELFLGDLPRHVEADGAVLLHLHARQLALRARDLAGHVVIRIAVQRRQPGHDQVRMFQHALDLAPDQGLEPLGADHRMLATAQGVRRLHPVALVVAPWRIEVVAVGLPAAPDGVAPLRDGTHQHAALAAADEVLEQVEHLRIARGADPPPHPQRLRLLPDLVVHERGEGHADPAVAGLLVDAGAVVGGDVAGFAVPPGAQVGLVAEDAVDLRRVPARSAPARGDVLARESLGDREPAHALVDVLPEDTPHHLGVLLVDGGRALLGDAVAEGNAVDGDAALLGGPALAHRGALAEVVELDLADRRHEAEGLHVDRVHHRLDADALRLDDLHEGGGGVHAAAEAVGLPADDGVEAPVPGVGEHALELGALLGPAASHLLVARGDGVAALRAVGLHVADLLGEGGLVVLGLALVGDARVDGGAAVLGLSWRSRSRHGCLLRIQRPASLRGRVRER